MTFLPLKRSESGVARHYSRNMKEPTHIEYIGDKVTLGCIRQINVGSSVRSISFFDRNQVLSGSSSGACLWNVNSGELIRESFGGDERVSLPYLENGIVVTNRDGAVSEWDSEYIISIAAKSSKYYAAGSEDGAIQLWDYRKMITIGEPLQGHSGKVLALSFDEARHQYLASGSEDQSIIVWDLKKREKAYPPLEGHSGSITSLAFIGWRDTLVSGSLDGTVRLWKVSSGEMLHSFCASGMGGVYSIAHYDDRHILSGSEDGIIRMWDTKHSDMPPKKFVGHTGKVISLSTAYIDRGRRFASGSEDGTIRVWDIEKEHVIVGGTILAIAVSPNGEYLVSGSGIGTVCVWRIETGELINGPSQEHSTSVTSVSFSPDGFHYVSSSYNEIIFWNLDGDSVTCSCERQRIRVVCFSPDGKHIASGSDDTIQIWDLESREVTLNLSEGHAGFINSICYSSDGKKIVSGSFDKTICIWDASNGAVLLTFQGHSGGIVSVTYSHNGSYLISGSEDGTIRLLNADNGNLVRELIKVHKSSVTSVCFSPDDTHFVSGSRDKTICAWDTSTGELFFKANVPSTVRSVVFLPPSDGKYTKFASASNNDGSIRIWSVDIEEEKRIWNAPNSDGWVTGNDGNLLSWLPSDIRPTLIYGSCVRILNSRRSTTLTLSKYQGNQWTSCFPSRID